MKRKSLPLGLVNVFEVVAAAVIGFLFRDLIELLVVLFSIKVSSTWIALILAVPLLLFAIKAHYAFRRWLVRKGWLNVERI